MPFKDVHILSEGVPMFFEGAYDIASLVTRRLGLNLRPPEATAIDKCLQSIALHIPDQS